MIKLAGSRPATYGGNIRDRHFLNPQNPEIVVIISKKSQFYREIGECSDRQAFLHPAGISDFRNLLVPRTSSL